MPETYPQRDERSREEPAGRDAGRSAGGGSDPGLPPSLRVGRDRDPIPAIGLQPITSRAAATTTPAVAAATALPMAGAAAAAPVRGLSESAAALYNEVESRIPGGAIPEAAMESAGSAVAGLLGAAAGPLGPAATGPLGRAAAALPALPGSLPRLRPPAGLPGPAAGLARAIPTQLPPPIELVAPGIASALSGAAGPIGAAPARSATTSASAADEGTPEPTDPAELDRLAGQLYGRIQRHLNADLLIGRERAQMLTDLG
jgi:hypothetical protein